MVSNLQAAILLLRLTKCFTVYWDVEDSDETRPFNQSEDVLGANDSDHLPIDDEEDQIII